MHPEKQKVLHSKLQELLAAGVIEEARSPWSSNVCILRKPHNPDEYRFICDLRKVNSLIKFDRYALPKCSEFLDSLQGSTIFSVLDLKSAIMKTKEW